MFLDKQKKCAINHILKEWNWEHGSFQRIWPLCYYQAVSVQINCDINPVTLVILLSSFWVA